jgi:hypothetical protein
VSAYFDLPAATFILKELYADQLVENEVYSENPAFALIAKKTDFYGEVFPIPTIYGLGQGRSSTFATAQSNQTATQGAKFMLTRKRDYQIFTIDNETKMAMGSDKGAFTGYIESVVDPAVQNITMSAASALFRAGTGSIGKIATGGITSGVITLTNVADVVQFEVNQTLQANATDGGASPRSALGYVISVDRVLGTVTVASSGFGGSAASPTSWTAGDFLVIQGDNNMKMVGFAGWLLSSAPSTSDNFYGVNRSADRWRLAGGYYDGSAQPIEEALIDASMLLGREGAGPSVCFMPFASFGALEKSLGGKVQYETVGAGELGFDSIKINGPKGKINCIPDRNCQAATGWLLKMPTWKLYSLGELPQLLTYEDNNKMLRISNADAMEGRVGYYGNPGCNAPGRNAQVALSV